MCAGHCLIKELGGGLFYLDESEVYYPVDGSVRTLIENVIMTVQVERVKIFCEIYNKAGIYLD